jgi:hypothetical protein
MAKSKNPSLASITISNYHAEAHLVFLEQLRSFSTPAANPTNNMLTPEPVDNHNLPDSSDGLLDNFELLADDEQVFNVVSNLLPPNFKSASFLTPEMIKYHQNEHERPGYGIACIVHDAFSLTEDVSQMKPEEVQFHIDACRLCIEITRSKVSVFGSILHEIITYFTSVPKSGVQSSASQNDYIDRVSNQLQEKLPYLPVQDLSVIRRVLGDTFDNFSTKPAECMESSQRGLFYATRPPQNESKLELNRFYLQGPNSIYENLPCQKATMSKDMTHATVSRQGIVASFIAMGIELFNVDPTVLKVPSSSFFSSNVAKTTNRRAAKLQNEFRCPSKVTPIHWKDWGDNAEKTRSSRRNLLSFHLRTFTFMTLDGNGDVDYYCFVVALGLKGDIHDIIKMKFNDEPKFKVLSQPNEYCHGGYKANMMAAVFLVASIRDKPAKADANMTGHHNQLFSRRSRWASFLDVDIHVDSCSRCAGKRRKKLR